MKIPDHIFRQYDIRGLVDGELTPYVTCCVGKAYGTLAREQLQRTPRVAVGRDNRPSSPALSDGLVQGLMRSGADVLDLGTVPTPTAYWAEKTLPTDGAIQITGSHNPPEWNGIKMTLGGSSVYGEAIQGLKVCIDTEGYGRGKGTCEHIAVLEQYLSDLAGRFKISRPVKVVLDCGNGTGSLVGVRLLEEIGAEVIPLYCDSDGTFPNHHPDPTVDEYLVDLIDTVRRERADLGIGFDGDADRIGAVDESGNVVRGDLLLLLFGLDLIRRRESRQKLVFDVKCSQVLPDEFTKAGGEAIMWKTGHSLIKEKMKAEGAALGGELSGHICVADSYFGFDDAPYAACLLIDLIARSGRSLADMVSDFPRLVSTPELRIDVTEETKVAIVEAAKDHFSKTREVNTVDGARISFAGGWGLLRASNTQPIIVARYEASTAKQLKAIRSEVESWLSAQGVAV
jgi:phosphomannomutase/phosphoglucomutase